MPVVLTRTGQIGRKIEGTEGTAETLAAGDFQGNFKGQGHEYTPTEYQRELQRASLSKDATVKGHRSGMIKFVEELVGGAAATAAPWATTLRGMGFSAGTTLKAISIGAITGTAFNVGDRIGDNATEGSATKTGTAVGVWNISGTNKLVYVPGTGTFASADVIRNYTVPGTSATASSAAADAGRRYRPVTETESVSPPSLTVERRHGGEQHILVGARGKGAISGRMGEIGLLEAEFMGPCIVDDTTGRPATVSAMTGIAAVGVAPLAVKGQRIRIGTTVPVLTEFRIDINNTLAPRGTIADDDISQSGYLPTRISDREITMTLDPEYVAGAGPDSVGRSLIGTTFKFEATVGKVNHANGLVLVYGPSCQVTGPATEGERDGVKTAPLNVQFCRVVEDDEIEIFHVFL